jgi:hypothetical protein
MDAALQEQISSLETRGFTYIYLHKENNSVGNTDYNDKPLDELLENSIAYEDVPVKHYYYIDKNGNKIKLPTLSEGIPTENIITETQIIRQPFFKVIKPNIKNYTLYLLYDNNIIGFVRATDKNDKVYISYVEINELYQKRGLCKEMMKLFIHNVNFYNNYNAKFSLINAGGIAACKCYINAFKECNYDSFVQSGFGNPDKPYYVSLCDEESNNFNFIPINQNAGQKKKKLTKRKTIKRKTKKRKSNKYLFFRRQK